jgi:hypothetical protein
VDDAEGFKAQAAGFFQVRFNSFLHIPRPHAVEIKNICDWDTKWLVAVHACLYLIVHLLRVVTCKFFHERGLCRDILALLDEPPVTITTSRPQ